METESPTKPVKSSEVVAKLVKGSGSKTQSKTPTKTATAVLESDDEVYSSDD